LVSDRLTRPIEPIPEAGEREVDDDDRATEQVVPAAEPGWVEMFLGSNEHGLSLRDLPRPLNRSGRRPMHRRV
jgi:hypothetical protein